MQIAHEYYQRNNMILDIDHPIEFEENQIKLDIPYPEGVTTKNKEWRIISLTPPVVRIMYNTALYVMYILKSQLLVHVCMIV